MSDARIVVLSPVAERSQRAPVAAIAPRLETLEGARLAFVDNGFESIAVLHDAFRRGLETNRIRPIIERKRYWQPLERVRLEALAGAADAVVGGLCNTPPSTTWNVHDAVALERLGRPTVTLATAYYEELVADSAAIEGMPDLRRIILPYPLENQPEPVVWAVAEQAIGLLVAALTDPGSPLIGRVALPPDR